MVSYAREAPSNTPCSRDDTHLSHVITIASTPKFMRGDVIWGMDKNQILQSLARDILTKIWSGVGEIDPHLLELFVLQCPLRDEWLDHGHISCSSSLLTQIHYSLQTQIHSLSGRLHLIFLHDRRSVGQSWITHKFLLSFNSSSR